MKRPHRASGRGEVISRHAENQNPTQASLATQPEPRIIVDGSTVTIESNGNLAGVPRRQGFAWPDNAKAYAEQLGEFLGWPVEFRRAGDA